MTYHAGLGEIGTYKQFGTATANFRVGGLNGTSAQSNLAKTRIVAAMQAVPGVTGASAAWQSDGTVLATMRMAAGSLVNGTADTIRRVVGGIGAQIAPSVTVTVTRTAFVPADIDRTPATPPPAAEPAVPVLPDSSYAPASSPAETPSTGMSTSVKIAAVGAGVLVLGAAAFFLLRKKKPSSKLTVGAP